MSMTELSSMKSFGPFAAANSIIIAPLAAEHAEPWAAASYNLVNHTEYGLHHKSRSEKPFRISDVTSVTML
jgi:pyridoxal/pyridoxine/pyridoxamine kinase